MNQTLPKCARCLTSYWPSGHLDPNPSQHICENCVEEKAVDEGVALSSSPDLESPQPAGSQPYGEDINVNPRLPRSGSRLRIQPRELPGSPSPNQVKSPIPSPAPPQTLAFNCPACMGVLNIARDLAIAGTTAPCPHCSSMVIPPRIAPASALRPTRESRWRPER